jgi:hypothetical protein
MLLAGLVALVIPPFYQVETKQEQESSAEADARLFRLCFFNGSAGRACFKLPL